MSYKPNLPYLPLENSHTINWPVAVRGAAAGLVAFLALNELATITPAQEIHKEQTSFTILCDPRTEPVLTLHPDGEQVAPLIDSLGHDTAAIVGVTCEGDQGHTSAPNVYQSNQLGNCYKKFTVLTLFTEQPEAKHPPKGFLKNVGTMSLVGVSGSNSLRFTNYNLQQAPYAKADNDAPGSKYVPCRYRDITPSGRNKDLAAPAIGPSFR